MKATAILVRGEASVDTPRARVYHETMDNEEEIGLELASDGLLGKQYLFVLYYTGECLGNATASARKAGYDTTSAASLAEIGRQLLRHPKVHAAIRERLDERAMSGEEVLARLASIARGDIRDLIGTSGDIALLDADGNLKDSAALIKKISRTTDGNSVTMTVELYSQLEALTTLARVHGYLRGDGVNINQTNNIVHLSPAQMQEVFDKVKQYEQLPGMVVEGSAVELPPAAGA